MLPPPRKEIDWRQNWMNIPNNNQRYKTPRDFLKMRFTRLKVKEYAIGTCWNDFPLSV